MEMRMTAAQEDRMLHNSFLDDVTVKPLGNGRYATRSAKSPAGTRYLTTADSCTCPGFAQHGRCKHLSRVRFEQSFAAPAPAVCPTCGGREVVTYRAGNGKWALDTCPDCTDLERYG